MMKLGHADVYDSHYISNCDEAWVTVSSGIFGLPPQLGLEPATHTSEALEERYLNGSQRIYEINHSDNFI